MVGIVFGNTDLSQHRRVVNDKTSWHFIEIGITETSEWPTRPGKVTSSARTIIIVKHEALRRPRACPQRLTIYRSTFRPRSPRFDDVESTKDLARKI